MQASKLINPLLYLQGETEHCRMKHPCVCFTPARFSFILWHSQLVHAFETCTGVFICHFHILCCCIIIFYGENNLNVNPTSVFNLFYILHKHLERTLKGVGESALELQCVRGALYSQDRHCQGSYRPTSPSIHLGFWDIDATRVIHILSLFQETSMKSSDDLPVGYIVKLFGCI